MDQWQVLFVLLFWTGPIGVGIFLMALGVYYWGKAQAQGTERK